MMSFLKRICIMAAVASIAGCITVQAAPYEGDTGYGAGYVPQASAIGQNKGPLVSLNVANADVKDVLSALARMGNANIIVANETGGSDKNDKEKKRITIQIKSLEFETALDLVAKMAGLQYHKVGDVILVGNKDEVNENFGTMHVFKLKYANPSTILAPASLALGFIKNKEEVETVDDTDSNSTSVTSKIDRQKENEFVAESNKKIVNRLTVDKATNSLLLFGTQEEANSIRRMLNEIDIPYQQVSLEAEVIALNKDASKNLGIEWDWSRAPQIPATEVEYTEVAAERYNPVTGEYVPYTYQVPKPTIKRGWKREDSNEGGHLDGGIISFGHAPGGGSYEIYYSAKINALVTDGKASILARPNINTINGKEAVINIGGQVPVPKVTANANSTTTDIEYKDTGIILRYTPQINEDGYITANVYTEVSSPQYVPEMKAYRFNKRSADTVVRLKDGETMVIGGLIGSEESRTYSKIPFLGDIPIIGKFFSNVNNSKNKSEVMIFLTAKIVK